MVDTADDAADPSAHDTEGSPGSSEDDETATVHGMEIKLRIRSALAATVGSTTRAAVRSVLDSAEYKALLDEFKFTSPNAVMLHIEGKRAYVVPQDQPLRCLKAFLTILEASVLTHAPGTFITPYFMH